MTSNNNNNNKKSRATSVPKIRKIVKRIDTLTGCEIDKNGYLIVKNTIDHEIEFMETIAALNFKHVWEMSTKEFLIKYREIYLHHLKTMATDDLHYEALVIDKYLHPMVKDMLKLVEQERSVRLNREGAGVGEV